METQNHVFSACAEVVPYYTLETAIGHGILRVRGGSSARALTG